MMFDFEVGDSFAQPDFMLYGGGPKDKKKKKGITRQRFKKSEDQPIAQRPRKNPIPSIQRDKRAS